MLATYGNSDCRVIMITGSTLVARGEIFLMARTVSTVLRKPVPVDDLLAASAHVLAATG